MPPTFQTMPVRGRRPALKPGSEPLASLARSGRTVENWEARRKDPASIIRPTTIQEVQDCVRWALKHKTSLTVVGGGHSGHCLIDDVVAVDLSAFNQIHVLPTEETPSRGPIMVVESGCSSGEVISKAMKAGLTVPLGSRPSVGAGLWLQGGIGHLSRLHGLACDNIIGAIVVSVASGQILRIGYVPDQHCPANAVIPENASEVLWGLRGAGTNFGIVISVTFTAHTAPIYNIRNWVYSTTEDHELVRKAEKIDGLARMLPRRMSTDAYLWLDGNTWKLGVTMFEICTPTVISNNTLPNPDEIYTESGNEEDPFTISKAIYTALGHEEDSIVVDSMGLFETDMFMSKIHGGHSSGRTSSFKRCIFVRHFAHLLNAAKDTMIASPTPLCYIHLLHGGGAVQDIQHDGTAFGSRGWYFACVVTGVWPREQDGTDIARATVQWVYDVVDIIGFMDCPFGHGQYSADLGPDPRDATLAAGAFGWNMGRLVELKRKMDPGNVLAHACPFNQWPEEQDDCITVDDERSG